MPLRLLREHLPSGFDYVCVQRDVRESELAELAGLERSGWRRPRLGDLADTAALLATLDAVVSVDSAIAHLAGATGRPVCLVLPASSEWRWGRDATETPWYAEMRLCRQAETGDWASALQEAAAALRILTFPRGG